MAPQFSGKHRIVSTLGAPAEALVPVPVEDDYVLPMSPPAPEKSAIVATPAIVSTPPVQPPPAPKVKCRTVDYGPRPEESISFSCSPRRSSWTHEYQGLRFSMRIEPEFPRVGETFTLFMSSSQPDSTCCHFYIWWGDGTGFNQSSGVSCPEGPTHYRPEAQTTHAYSEARPWEFLAGTSATRGDPCQGEYSMTYTSIFGYFDVAE